MSNGVEVLPTIEEIPWRPDDSAWLSSGGLVVVGRCMVTVGGTGRYHALVCQVIDGLEPAGATFAAWWERTDDGQGRFVTLKLEGEIDRASELQVPR